MCTFNTSRQEFIVECMDNEDDSNIGFNRSDVFKSESENEPNLNRLFESSVEPNRTRTGKVRFESLSDSNNI